MKVLLYSRYGEYPKEIEKLVKSFGLEIASNNPEVVISYGGDGTFLGAERDYPGVPKLYLRDSGTCYHCSPLPNDKLLEFLVAGKLKTRELLQVETEYQGKQIVALNEILIAHKTPNLAIRFKTSLIKNVELIGDGVLLATPFGSTAYFQSITKTTFQEGLGVAFNNLHNCDDRYKLIPETEAVIITVTRGPALLAWDNDPNYIEIQENQPVTIKKSNQVARFLIP